ncbi:MAG: hypothetical protein L3V56_04710 [Candidatus Magnetoovum sp. WYHC-5]|nr:hypothetical protein [Candidatus Magnetoovum sp. WYHC-5]
MKELLVAIYQKMYEVLGAQRWWPGETQMEVAIGAILTQNTAWSNVEKAIYNLKQKVPLDAFKINALLDAELAELIKPTGYYNIKAKRLKTFLFYLIETYDGSMENMQNVDTASLREELLNVKGVGAETADSILLYALERPVFVIDAYTKRILSRHKVLAYKMPYEDFQDLFHSNLSPDVELYNEYHALFVNVGKNFCKTANPKCTVCPLAKFL